MAHSMEPGTGRIVVVRGAAGAKDNRLGNGPAQGVSNATRLQSSINSSGSTIIVKDVMICEPAVYEAFGRLAPHAGRGRPLLPQPLAG